MEIDFKSLTNEEADSIIGDMEFKTPMYLHQKASLLFCYDKKQAGVFSDVGTGKTIIALYTAQLKGYKKIFVVCPNSVKYNWEKEVCKHTHFTAKVLEGTGAQKKMQLFGDQNVTITNYESLRTILGNPHNVLDVELLSRFNEYDLFIVDEIHKVKSYKAIQSRLCRLIAEEVTDRIGLTGSPIGNDLLDLFNVFLVIDKGQTFGNNFFQYRKKYFDKVEGWFADTWNPKPNAEVAIAKEAEKVVIRYTKDECLDLPEKVYEIRGVELSNDQKTYIDKLTLELRACVEGTTINIPTAVGLTTKISQITGGAVINPENGELIYLESNSKLDELMNLIEDIDGKIVVYHRFVGEGRLIEKALLKNKIKYASLRGEISNKQSQIDKFLEDPKVRIMVANPASGGVGLNFHVASTMIFYSNAYSYLDRYQAEGRIHRIGQSRMCLYIDILAKDSIDERVYEILMNKKNVSDNLLILLQ
jgi:SNF2 family DNA or RNA helicase